MLFCIITAVSIYLFMGWDARRRLEDMYIRDPAEIARIADSMADYELPPNYEEAMVTKLNNTHVLYLIVNETTPDNLSYPRISLVQFQAAQYPSAAAAREKMRLSSGVTGDLEDGTYEVTGTETVLVRGQAVELTHFTWFTPEGTAYRSLVSDVFEGKEGFLQLLIEGEAQGWDEDAIQAFIQSIH